MNVAAIGEYLRSCRKALGLTQGDVAEHLRVSPQAVSKWERGENMPDVTLFPDIAKLLQTSIDEILRGAADTDAESFAYLNPVQKAHFIEKLLTQGEYAPLDDILPYCNIALKTQVLSHLLAQRRFDAIEDNVTTFNRKHRDLIVDFFTQNQTDEDIIENFIPFFDNNQRERLRDKINMEEELS